MNYFLVPPALQSDLPSAQSAAGIIRGHLARRLIVFFLKYFSPLGPVTPIIASCRSHPVPPFPSSFGSHPSPGRWRGEAALPAVSDGSLMPEGASIPIAPRGKPRLRPGPCSSSPQRPAFCPFPLFFLCPRYSAFSSAARPDAGTGRGGPSSPGPGRLERHASF